MQECPVSPRGVVNKELNSKPQTEDCNYCLALQCVAVCMRAGRVCVLRMWQSQSGDCSHLIICKYSLNSFGHFELP